LDQTKKSKVITITSTETGEGKTFTSINLAHALSHSGKKTVLVGLDLRAPKMGKYLGIDAEFGVSNYIVDDTLTLKDILLPVDGNPLLSYVLSGSIPPNPAELFLRKRFSDLIEVLKNQFDYIIFDTAPVGIVSDTLNIFSHCDLVLYIARANKLEKRFLHLPQNLISEKKVPKLTVLINGVTNDYKGYGYAYGYGYGYGEKSAAYYVEEKPILPRWKKIIYRWTKRK
jgi:capsular exopolysaccharide synthesis family protein